MREKNVDRESEWVSVFALGDGCCTHFPFIHEAPTVTSYPNWIRDILLILQINGGIYREFTQSAWLHGARVQALRMCECVWRLRHFHLDLVLYYFIYIYINVFRVVHLVPLPLSNFSDDLYLSLSISHRLSLRFFHSIFVRFCAHTHCPCPAHTAHN